MAGFNPYNTGVFSNTYGTGLVPQQPNLSGPRFLPGQNPLVAQGLSVFPTASGLLPASGMSNWLSNPTLVSTSATPMYTSNYPSVSSYASAPSTTSQQWGAPSLMTQSKTSSAANHPTSISFTIAPHPSMTKSKPGTGPKLSSLQAAQQAKRAEEPVLMFSAQSGYQFVAEGKGSIPSTAPVVPVHSSNKANNQPGALQPPLGLTKEKIANLHKLAESFLATTGTILRNPPREQSSLSRFETSLPPPTSTVVSKQAQERYIKVMEDLTSNMPGGSDTYNKNANYRAPVSKRFVCIECGESFPFNDELKSHLGMVHYDTRPFQCPCGRKFWEKETLNDHEQSAHVNGRAIHCIVCGAYFHTLKELKAHASQSHPSRSCARCGFEFMFFVEYKTHVENAHKPKLDTVSDDEGDEEDFADEPKGDVEEVSDSELAPLPNEQPLAPKMLRIPTSSSLAQGYAHKQLPLPCKAMPRPDGYLRKTPSKKDVYAQLEKADSATGKKKGKKKYPPYFGRVHLPSAAAVDPTLMEELTKAVDMVNKQVEETVAASAATDRGKKKGKKYPSYYSGAHLPSVVVDPKEQKDSLKDTLLAIDSFSRMITEKVKEHEKPKVRVATGEEEEGNMSDFSDDESVNKKEVTKPTLKPIIDPVEYLSYKPPPHPPQSSMVAHPMTSASGLPSMSFPPPPITLPDLSQPPPPIPQFQAPPMQIMHDLNQVPLNIPERPSVSMDVTAYPPPPPRRSVSRPRSRDRLLHSRSRSPSLASNRRRRSRSLSPRSMSPSVRRHEAMSALDRLLEHPAMKPIQDRERPRSPTRESRRSPISPAGRRRSVSPRSPRFSLGRRRHSRGSPGPFTGGRSRSPEFLRRKRSMSPRRVGSPGCTMRRSRSPRRRVSPGPMERSSRHRSPVRRSRSPRRARSPARSRSPCREPSPKRSRNSLEQNSPDERSRRSPGRQRSTVEHSPMRPRSPRRHRSPGKIQTRSKSPRRQRSSERLTHNARMPSPGRMYRAGSPKRLSSLERTQRAERPRRISPPERMQRSKSPRRLSSPGRMRKPGSPRRSSSPGRMQRSKSPRRLSSPGRMRKPGSPRRSSSPGRMQRSRSPRRLSSPGRMQKPGSPRRSSSPGRMQPSKSPRRLPSLLPGLMKRVGSPTRLPSPGRMQRGRSPRRLPSPGRMQRSRSPRRLPSPSGRVKRLGSPSRLPSPGRMQRYGSPRGLRSPGRMQRSRSPRRPSSPGRMQRGGSPIRLPSPGRMQRSGSPRRGRSPAVGRRSRSPRRPPSPVLVKRPGSSVVRLGRESESPKRVRRTSVKSRSPPIHRRQMSQGQSAERSGSPRGRGGIERWSFSPSSRLEHELPASMNDGAEVYRPEVVNAEETRPVSISPGRFSDLEGHRERARMSSAPRGRGQWNYTRGRSSFRGRRSSDSRSDRRSPLPMDSPREGSPVLADTRFQGGSSPLQSGSPMVRLNQFEPPMMRSRSRSPLNRRLGGRVRRFSPPPRRQEEGQFDPGFAPLGDAEKDAQFSPEFRSGSLSPVLVGGGPIRVTVRGDNDEREIAFERPEDTMDHEERARLLEQELAAIEHRLEQNQPDRDELEHRQLIEEREERFRILDQELAHLEEIGAVPMADDEEGRGYSPPRFSPPLSRSSFPYRGESPHYRGMSQRPMRQFEGGRGHVRGGRAWGRGRFFHPRARGGPFPHYAMEGNRFHPGERQPLAERLDFLPEEPRAWFAREGSDGPGSRERFRTGDHRPHSRERWNPRPPDRSTERPKGPPLNQSDNLREDEIPPLNPPTDGKPLRSDVEKKPSKSDDHEKPPPVVNVSKKPWQSDDGKKPSKSENDKKSGEQKSQLSTEQKNLPAAMDVKKPIPKAEGKQPLLKKSDEKTEVSAKSCSVLEEPVDGEETFYCRHCNMDFDEKAAVDGHEKSCRYKLRPLSDAQVKICSICKRDFQEIFIPLIKTKRDGLIECRLCDPGSRLIKAEDFLPHLDSAHRRGRSSHRQRCAEKSRKCGMCPFLCASYGHYKRHMGEVHRQVLED